MNDLKSLFPADRAHWYSIKAGRPFLEDIAWGLYETLGTGLSEALILVPTRRGARALTKAFSTLATHHPLLLPQIRAIGDLEEGESPFESGQFSIDLPPAIGAVRKRLELARLIQAHYRPLNADQRSVMPSARLALEFADTLSGFFDSIALEEVDARGKLSALIEADQQGLHLMADYAKHWALSAQFLDIALTLWPQRLAQLGLIDPGVRQVALIRNLCAQWSQKTPTHPILLIGSTGSAPAMADLMAVIAKAPLGCVVLPGLDLHISDDAWDLIDDQHPQSTMKALLTRHGIDRTSVSPWPYGQKDDAAQRARQRLLSEALRPAEATRDWLNQIKQLRAEGLEAIKQGLDGLYLIETNNDEEAARTIALLIREGLETPDKRIALITPDTGLARRVNAQLSQWGLGADSSQGSALAHSMVGRFLLDGLNLAIDSLDLISAQSLFHNPICRFHETPEALRSLDLMGLRGPRPSRPEQVEMRIKAGANEAEPALMLWQEFQAAALVFHQSINAQGPRLVLGTLIRAWVGFCEALGDQRALWKGAEGAQASALLSELIEESADFEIASCEEARLILGHIFAQSSVRTGGHTHPRLMILGAIEARLISADLLILAGLEEGIWPRASVLDPFLSRPMRKRLGLPSPERRLGLSAHDFVQASSAPIAYMITRQRVEGQPRVASRWLWRLKTLCQGIALMSDETQKEGLGLKARPELLAWARLLDTAPGRSLSALAQAPRPAPTPDLHLRPKRFSVTEVSTLMRDPYAIYAKRILGLKPLDRVFEPYEARQRGTAIHAIAEAFGKEALSLRPDAEDLFCERLAQEFTNNGMSAPELALQKPFLSDMAEHFLRFDRAQRQDNPTIFVEQKGVLEFNIMGDAYQLTARADRIERRPDKVDIFDFKSGQASSNKVVLSGLDPQLTLTAAIIRRGRFGELDAKDVSIGSLSYVFISQRPKVTRDVAKKNEASANELAEAAFEQFTKRLMRYRHKEFGYVSMRAPSAQDPSGDYDLLARRLEWQSISDDTSTEPDDAEITS